MKAVYITFLIIIPFYGFSQHTFSIVAVDSVTGEIGSAGATCLDNVILQGEEGALVISDIILGVGAIHTQAWWDTTNQFAARARMENGDSPQEIIDWLIQNDSGKDGANINDRQYGIININNGHPRTAAYTGSSTPFVTNHIRGANYSIQGNTLLERAVLDDMESSFLNTSGSLADKLMAAMQGAKRIGADRRCSDDGVSSLSAFLRVAQPNDTLSGYGQLNLDINIGNTPNSVDPINSLQNEYDQWLIANYDAAYLSRGLVSSTYLQPGIDTLTLSAVVYNHAEHDVEVFAKITDSDNLLVDSLSLFNDGLHNDAAFDDSIWAVQFKPESIEKSYKVSITTIDKSVGLSFINKNITQFTTIGPVKVTERAYIDTSYNQDTNTQFILLTIKNYGITTKAKDLSVTLNTEDPRIEKMEISTRTIPDLEPGEIDTSTIFSLFAFVYADSFLPDCTLINPILFNVDVFSDGYLYWTSSFEFVADKISTIKGEQHLIPEKYYLNQNYPNPFNPVTTISYYLPKTSKVKLYVFDLQGKIVATLVNNKQSAGIHKVEWDAKGFATGVYLYKLEVDDFVRIRKMVVLK
ncbi:MAG: DUF1028 domain-containing protein [Calditrichaeota bacterium]|nr:MAG: DUF1028 domain-containing protein [Calditrichota bacterium]MBL1204131.1 DUF1028 domain-containing protein [Calditrichota bacterium]NOG43962.1 DUF1028 domain-containing protein [Calditrichota bacterium]